MLKPELLQELTSQLGAANVLSDPADCWAYGYDNSRRQAMPDAVIFATTHADVLFVVKFCNQHRIPLIARGRGTGTPGGAVPILGGIVLSFERMQRIISIDPINRIMIVEPGVTNQAVQQAAAEYGFFWPPDPTSAAFCSIGGNLAYNSAGPRAVKYGTPRENTLGLRAITGEGFELRTGVNTTKGVVGYDLTRLLIGSEGTLALITEAILKLTPLPETKRVIQAIYQDVSSATTAITRIMGQAYTPCALEFIDGQAINMIRNYSELNFPLQAGALLLIEVDGTLGAIREACAGISQAASVSGLLEMQIAETEQQAETLWKTRKALSPALRTVAPKKINEDVVVPISHLPNLIQGLEKLAQKYQIIIINFGHAGNGNIHVNLLIDPDDAQQLARATACLDEIFSLVLQLGGTLSGEHGIGIEKKDFINRELDSVSLQLMRKIKQQFDPNGILNPGKIFPDTM